MLAHKSEIYRTAEQTRVIQLRQLMRPRQTKRVTTSLSLTSILRGLVLEVNALLTLLYPVTHHYSTQRDIHLMRLSPGIADECQLEHVD